MNKYEFLQSIRKEIHFVFDRDSIEQEFNQHIEDSIFDLIQDGYSKEEAEKIAIEQMGNPTEIGKQLNKEHHPLLGYLFVASRVVLALLIIPGMLILGTVGYDCIRMITPTTVKDSEIIAKLDIDFDIKTHDVKLDYLCKNKQGEYIITFRNWINHSYSRAGWSSQLFLIKDDNGNFRPSGGYDSGSYIGGLGYKTFEWPKNDILTIKTMTDEIITIDLKEYNYEEK